MVWVPKAEIQIANDPVLASHLRTEGSESNTALRDVLGELVPPGVSAALADPAVSGIVSNAVDARLATLAVLQALGIVTDQFEVAVGDADGRPTWMRADKAGAPTPAVIEALAAKGVTRAATGVGEEYEVAVGDEEGRATWMRADSTGWPSAIATEIIRAAGGFRMGPVQPTIYPGLPVMWFETDGYGNLIDIQGVGL